MIEKDGKRLLYTGDMAWMEKKYQKSLGQLDVVITEGSFIEKGGMIRRDKKSGKIFGHTGVPDIIRVFSKHSKRIIMMHFGTWFMEDVETARDKIKEITPEDTEVHAARDGEIFHV
ncbi:MAG: MBL fold metallo-hydrolase [Bacteroidales bacterium]